MAEQRGVLVFCEDSNGALMTISTEALGCGRKLADDLGSQLMGIAISDDTNQIAREAITFGADKMYVVNHPDLADYQTEPYVSVCEKLAKQLNPSIIIMGQTGVGRDLAPALAYHLDTTATLDCVELSIESESKRLLQTKPIYGGNAWAVYTTECNPQIVTIRAKSMEPVEPDPNREGEIASLEVQINPEEIRAKLVEKVPEQVEGIRLEDARVVIGGGRGIGNAEAFKKLEYLAKLLHGTVGASRAACDNGWIPSTKQIGLTGKVVTPELYFSVGISGASQHMAGCHGSTYIIAINNDDGAHIFNEAHYGILGDWEPVIDGFINKLQELGVE